MHRTITLTTAAGAADGLVQGLRELPGVTGLVVHPGAAVKPAGDEIVVHCLNRAADEVLRLARTRAGGGLLFVVTTEATSFTEPSAQRAIDHDSDEATWEEMEARLSQEGQTTSNFLALSLFGGAVAAAGLVSDTVPQAVALVAASVIAPGFEPVAKIPLGVVLGRWSLAWSGFLSALVCYAAVIASAAFALWAMMSLGAVTAEQFVGNPEVQRLARTNAVDLIVSAGGALAGITMIAAYRHDVIAGALMALMLIPGAAMVGGALAAREPDLAARGLTRAGADVLLMLAAGLLIFSMKQITVHRRRSLRRADTHRDVG